MSALGGFLQQILPQGIGLVYLGLGYLDYYRVDISYTNIEE